ncbi:hypothetical protein GA829_13725 [Mesorhizobium sp. INR15]|nr:hypothetical protein GA829_13725 [Mesorhizobium sp. INR15]
MPLRLVIENATSKELARGVAAAKAAFERSGISIQDAMSGMLALELWDMKGFPEGEQPTEEEEAAAGVWFEAEREASEACCASWPEDKIVLAHGVLGFGLGEPKVKTANLATWVDRQQRYQEVIERLETATGSDRQLDIDICYVMGWINEPGTPEEAAQLGLPYLTSNLAEVAAITAKSIHGWKIEIDQQPCDARIVELDLDEDDEDNLSVAAWRCFDGRLHMMRPPANAAIALTLAAMRLQADSFLPGR